MAKPGLLPPTYNSHTHAEGQNPKPKRQPPAAESNKPALTPVTINGTASNTPNLNNLSKKDESVFKKCKIILRL
jgi:hypothetical protein